MEQENRMDVLEFTEKVLDYKLNSFQKEYLRLLESGKRIVCMPARNVGLQFCREAFEEFKKSFGAGKSK